MIRVLSILVVLQLAGEILAKLLQLPLPGGLVGMLLLLAALLCRQRVSPEMHQTSQLLLQNLMLLFIPFVAGIVSQADQIKAHWLPFLASCLLGAVITLIITAWTFQWMLTVQQRRAHHAD